MNAMRRPVVCSHITVTISIDLISDEMKLPKFLRLPKSHRRARSKPGSEVGPIGGQIEADLATPRPTESTPDLQTGTSTLRTLSSPTPHDQESVGM
jgi:hypothetical protein